MFGKRIRIFELFGFTVRIDLSWLIIAVLITWTLAEGVFPNYYEGLSKLTYWIMGFTGAIGLFISIVLHELSHSLVARNFGMPMEGITLFIFGGVAEMEDEPPSPGAEFSMGIAGPLMSIVLGFVFLGIYFYGRNAGFPESVNAVFGYLRWINFVLAGFNLLPAFPLDGGRLFRSILWKVKNNLKWATRIASRIGAGFGFLLIFLGVFFIIRGAFIGGIWWILIGLFMRNASRTSYRRLLMRDELEGERVARFMKEEPVTVKSSLNLHEVVENYIYKFHYKMYPVVDNEEVKGCITTREIKNVPREKWEDTEVREVMSGCSEENTISPNADAMDALTRMNKTKNSRLMVVKNRKLEGIITLKDLLEFFSIKMDLGSGEIKR